MNPGKKNCPGLAVFTVTSPVDQPSFGRSVSSAFFRSQSFSIATMTPFSSTQIAESCKYSSSSKLLLWMKLPKKRDFPVGWCDMISQEFCSTCFQDFFLGKERIHQVLICYMPLSAAISVGNIHKTICCFSNLDQSY